MKLNRSVVAVVMGLTLLSGAASAQPFPADDRPLFPVLPHGDATPGMPRSPFWQGMNDARDAGRDIVLGPLPLIAPRPAPAPPTPTFTALTTMPQNWAAATGELMYSYQAIDVRAGGRTAQQMWGELTTFQHFNAGNIATARMITAPPGTVGPDANRRFVMFRADPAMSVVGGLNFAQQFLNSEWVPVEIFTNERDMTITAVTMGDHMIVGVRRWTVKPNADGSYRIETEAWEQRNGMINNVAMVTGVPLVLSGKEVMGMVWDRYLNNLGQRATTDGGSYRYTPGTNGEAGLWRHRPRGTQNPFRAGIPGSGVPGQMPPPGFFGPDFGPGDPTVARGFFHPQEFQRNIPLLLVDTDRRVNNVAFGAGMEVLRFDNDVRRIRRTAPWYRVPDQVGGAAINRTVNAAGVLQNEFIESDINQRIALPLRRAAEGTVIQIRDDFIDTPLNQNYLLPARRAVEQAPQNFRNSPVNQELLRQRRKWTGNSLDWLLGANNTPAPGANTPGGVGGWNGGLYAPTNAVAYDTGVAGHADQAAGAGMHRL